MRAFGHRLGAMEPEDMAISSVFGRGIYSWDGTVIRDPMRSRDKDLIESEQVAETPVLINNITEERYFARWFPLDSFECNRIRRIVLNPPPSDVMLVPSDLVVLTEIQGSVCDSAVWRVYADTAYDKEYPHPRAAVLFPVDGLPYVQSCAEMLDSVDGYEQSGLVEERHNWRDETIRSMAVATVRALARLNESGYAYLDFHRSRIFFRTAEETLSAYFDFTALACSCKDFERAPSANLRPQSPFYPLEFGDPAYLNDASEGACDALDFESQNYSLAAFLFYLLMGFHPYDGSRLLGVADDNLLHHYAKFGMYVKLPVFVFDPIDTSNAFGVLDEDQEIIALWEQLPQSLRQLFCDTLREPRAMRRASDINPTPKAWLRLFETLGWE